MTQAAHGQLASVVREHAGQLAAALMRVTGDFATAEDLVQDAVLAALEHWPVDGIPERPDAWLFTVARHRALDGFRRADNYRAKLAQLQWPVQPAEDERLRLIFTCCHPALSRAAQVALTLRVMWFNEGYLATAGPPPSMDRARDLTEDAEWLASLLHKLMPTEPEVAGLVALIRLHRARAAARFGADGSLVLLEEQDRSLWDREAIADAARLLARAARRQRPGPYQLQAAIVACHAEAARFDDTDWEQIVLLYDMLLHLAPSPVTRLHRAIAVRHATGARAAMEELDYLAGALDDYYLYHASRAELLRSLGHPDRARAADRRALELTANPAEQAVLRQRLAYS